VHAPASDRAIVDRLAQLRYAGGANRSHCLMEGKATRIPVEPAMGDEPAHHVKRIGLEAGPLSQWLYSALVEAMH